LMCSIGELPSHEYMEIVSMNLALDVVLASCFYADALDQLVRRH